MDDEVYTLEDRKDRCEELFNILNDYFDQVKQSCEDSDDERATRAADRVRELLSDGWKMHRDGNHGDALSKVESIRSHVRTIDKSSSVWFDWDEEHQHYDKYIKLQTHLTILEN